MQPAVAAIRAARGRLAGRAALSTASSRAPEDTALVAHRQRERDLILSVLGTVPSQREARKFLKSVSGSDTMRSQRAFEEQQAQLATQQAAVAQGRLAPGAALQHAQSRALAEDAAAADPETVPRRLTAAVFVDGDSCERTGKLLAQIQRIGVAPVVLLTSDAAGDYRSAIKHAHRLADAIEREGGKARPVNEGVFYNSPYSRAELTVDPELIGAAIAQRQAPIVSPLMADAALRMQMVPTAAAAVALARALALSSSAQHAMAGSGGAFSLLLARLILLGGPDGVESDGAFHRFVNLEEDYAAVAHGCARPDTLELMRTCLAILPPTAAGIVAAASSDPSLVLKGLISERPVATLHRTAALRAQRSADAAKRSHLASPAYQPLPNYPFVSIGPAVRPQPAPVVEEPPTRFTLLRHGFQIRRHTQLDACNLPRLRELLEQSFGRTLDGAYFDRLRALERTDGVEIIVAGDYQGAVI
ncbi:Amino-acid acetyltransferase, mitochondrial, partial [Coemansia nantahalensis]